jgi:outer membrane biosynthesis protein TonB
MKLVGAISTAVLSLSLGVGVPAYAQQEQQEQQEEKGKPAAGKDRQAQPEKTAQPEEKNARQQESNTKPQEKNAQQQNNSKQERTAQQQGNNKEENKPQEQHAKETRSSNQQDHASGKSGGRIPEDRYKANFGRDHRFHVTEGNYRDRRFQYGGYSFGFVDAWPGNWLYTQDVYVVEINGVYYLCNASYPGVNLELSFNL